jgi:hypothetical protein
MKKITIIMLLVASAIMTASAQVPDSIRMGFDKKYPNSNATWKTENGNYNAYYTDAGKSQRMISYDKNGRMISNSTLINSSDVPANISTYYKNNYPTDTHYKVWMDDMNGSKSYYINSGNNRYYFDSNGNYLRSGSVSNINSQDRQNQSTPAVPPAPNQNNPK